jgi:hypothetical protein
MKGKCRVVMTLGCCADGGDGKPGSKSPYKAQEAPKKYESKYTKPEAPKYKEEAEEMPKYEKPKDPISDAYGEYRPTESDYGRDKPKYGKAADEYERHQPKYVPEEDIKEYLPRHRDEPAEEAYAPKAQKPGYFDDFLNKDKEDKQQRKVAADYEPKGDSSENYRSYESEHHEAPRNPAEYEPRHPGYEEKVPESPYGEEKKEEKDVGEETPKYSDNDEADVPVVRYDPEEEEDEEAPAQPKNRRYDFMENRGSKGIKTRPQPLPESENKKNIDMGASRAPKVRGPMHQKVSQRVLEVPEEPQPRSREPVKHVQVPKLQQPQEQTGRRLPTASQVPMRMPSQAPSEHKGPQKITELPVFDAFRVKSDTDWLAEAEKQMSAQEEEPPRQPQPQQPKAVQPEPAKQADKPAAQPAPAAAAAQKSADKPQPKAEEPKKQDKAEPAPAAAKEAPKQPAPEVEQKPASQAQAPAAQAPAAAATKPSGASAKTA